MTIQSDILPRQPSLFWEVAKTLFYAFLIVTFVRTVLWQPFNIPSASMVQTLLVGDYVWVNKFAYGYSRYSLPFGPPLFEGRVWSAMPERGDVAVFKLPRDNSTDYIKRVVGMPGDTIQMKRGVLHINGQAVEMIPRGDVSIDMPDGSVLKGQRFTETLPGGRSYEIIDKYEAGAGDNTGIFTVPAGHYFMMGDNRDDSTDSRFAPEGVEGGFLVDEQGVGFVPYDNLVGRADALFFSANGSAGLFDFWNWPGAVRWERIFRSIE
jgi:signal peptidase I